MMRFIANNANHDQTAATADPCLVTNFKGIQYHEFSCLYPKLEPFYFEFEKNYEPAHVLFWMQEHAWVPIAACILYGVAIVYGQTYFSSHERWHWKYTLASWNAALSLFSTIGMLRTFPQLLHNLLTLSLRDNLCAEPWSTYGSGSSGLWIQLFVLSKFPELFDTFFIIIHKKPLIFLHWYHHITVLLYCWQSYVTTSPPGIFFVVMNYSVHACMYFYYCLMALRMRPKWLPPMLVTTLQISQMVVGVVVTLAGFYYYKNDPECNITGQNNTAAFVMYGSYLFLFLQFFIGRYVQPKVTIKPSKAMISKTKVV